MPISKRQFAFAEALIHMRAERKVYRLAWMISAKRAPTYLYMQEDRLFCHVYSQPDCELTTLEVEDILADDWMFYD